LARAGISRLAVDQHHAAAALLGAAAELGAAQVELLAQHGKQRRGAVGFDVHRPAVDGEIGCQFAFMPLASMNVDQCLISFSSLARNSEPGANDDSVSTLASRARTFGSAMTVWNAFSILALIGAGMPFGPKMPHQKPRSTSAVLRLSSPIAGTFGRAGERLV